VVLHLNLQIYSKAVLEIGFL